MLNLNSSQPPEQVFESIYQPGASFYLAGGNQVSGLNQKIVMGVGKPFQSTYKEFKEKLKNPGSNLLVQIDYEAVYEMESKLSPFSKGQNTVFGIEPEILIIYDLKTQRYQQITNNLSPKKESYPLNYPQIKVSDFKANQAKKDFIQSVHRIKEYIEAGDIFQCNFSQGLSGLVTTGHSHFEIFKKLVQLNPSPFGAYVEIGDRVLISNSPERLFQVDAAGKIQTRPIAGTYSVDRKPQDLLLNPKERAEHLMLIDLERNDLGRICETGTVAVDELMTTETYSHVIHIVSNIKGQLKKGTSPDQIFEALFPGGTITGVPKIRCMEIIRELEQVERKSYTGSLGMIYADGSMDFNILIRSLLIEGNQISARFGAGIVADSDPDREYQETLHKAQAIFKVLGVSI